MQPALFLLMTLPSKHQEITTLFLKAPQSENTKRWLLRSLCIFMLQAQSS